MQPSLSRKTWIWVSPRRFAIISNHPHNEKLNHFYSNKMHEHHILANRSICWNTYVVETDAGKKKDCLIALSDDTRICWASQETFITGFESEYGMRHITPKEEIMANANTQTLQGKSVRSHLMPQALIVSEICKL